jgi:hypothetical protein
MTTTIPENVILDLIINGNYFHWTQLKSLRLVSPKIRDSIDNQFSTKGIWHTVIEFINKENRCHTCQRCFKPLRSDGSGQSTCLDNHPMATAIGKEEWSLRRREYFHLDPRMDFERPFLSLQPRDQAKELFVFHRGIVERVRQCQHNPAHKKLAYHFEDFLCEETIVESIAPTESYALAHDRRHNPDLYKLVMDTISYFELEDGMKDSGKLRDLHLAMGVRSFGSLPHDEKLGREILQILLCRVYPSWVEPLSTIQRLGKMLDEDRSYVNGVSLFGEELYDEIDMLRDVRRPIKEKCRELEKEQLRVDEAKQAQYRMLVARVFSSTRKIEDGVEASTGKKAKIASPEKDNTEANEEEYDEEEEEEDEDREESEEEEGVDENDEPNVAE